MPKEKLRHTVILDALNEYKKGKDNMYNEKDVQETIYQMEDINNKKAFIYNKSTPKETIKGDVCVEIYDVYKLYKNLIMNVNEGITFPLLNTGGERVHALIQLRSNESWDKPRRAEEVMITLEDTLSYVIKDISDVAIERIKAIAHNELKRRKEIDKVVDKATIGDISDVIDG
tara:strand:- start:222 stop:740 length:519 start_codon:yes stop_codon:yes gene_type:complete